MVEKTETEFPALFLHGWGLEGRLSRKNGETFSENKLS